MKKGDEFWYEKEDKIPHLKDKPEKKIPGSNYIVKQSFWSKIKKNQIIIASGIILLLLIASAAAYMLLNQGVIKLPTTSPQVVSEEAVAIDPEMLQAGRLNILLLGSDSRGEENARADTIIWASIDVKNKKAQLLSIPRDTYVHIPDRDMEKINHSHAYGGPDLIMQTASEFLGVTIDKYIEVDFEGFEKIIDILGGVEINIEKRMLYKAEGIDLQAGLQTLNGKDALAYVRFRNDALADIGRIQRQQKFLAILSDKLKDVGIIFKLPSLVGQAFDMTKTNMSVLDLLGLANAMKSLTTGGIEMEMVPGVPAERNAQSVWLPDNVRVAEIVAYFTGIIQKLPPYDGPAYLTDKKWLENTPLANTVPNSSDGAINSNSSGSYEKLLTETSNNDAKKNPKPVVSDATVVEKPQTSIPAVEVPVVTKPAVEVTTTPAVVEEKIVSDTEIT
ncbi:MAG: LCP family protein [Clostridia bacterium]